MRDCRNLVFSLVGITMMIAFFTNRFAFLGLFFHISFFLSIIFLSLANVKHLYE